MNMRTWTTAGLAVAAAVSSSAAIRWPAHEVPVLTNVDVLVVGGASAGVAAAVEAARQGATVFLATPHPYLGDDICATLRLWLDPADGAPPPLVEAMFAAPPDRPDGRFLPLTYTADQPSDPRHRDTDPPRRLTDGKTTNAAKESVQYNGPVTLVADLGEPRAIMSAGVLAFQRPANFAVGEIEVSFGADGRAWSEPIRVRNPDASLHAEETAQPIRADVSVTQRFVRVRVAPAPGVERILLAEIAIEEPAPSAPRAGPAARIGRPMQIKRALDQALIEARVPFLFGCHVTDVLVDESRRPSGVILANRSGRQAVTAKTIVDATPEAVAARLAGARFASFRPGDYEFRRVVIGGEAVAGEGVEAIRRDPPLMVRAENGVRAPLIEYRLRLPLPADSWAARVEAEQIARDRTWTPDVRDAAETLFFVPPNAVVAHGSLSGPWPGAAAASMDAFRPAGIEALWVLGPYAAVDRAAVPAMMAPGEFVALGARAGAAAAAEAKRRGPAAGRLRPAAARPAPAGREGLTVSTVGVDATPRWASLPRLAIEAAEVAPDAEFDTVVVGGGTGGAPAGIGAARQGARTLVIETLHGLGGVGTWGQIAGYYYGYRKGFTEEVDLGVAAMGGATSPAHRWNVEHKGEWLRRELRKAGGRIWFGSLGVAALVQTGRVAGVVVATPRGPQIVRARAVIDATGNADVAAAAGAPCTYTDEAEVAVQGTGLPPRSLSRQYINTDYTFVDETDIVDIWRAFVVGRDLFPDAWDQGRLIDTRERRRIVGDVEISPLDLYLGRTWSDAIALAQSNFDSHGYTVHTVFALRPPDKSSMTVPVPYRALLPRGVDRLLVIGLGISSHRDALPVLRMQPDIQNHGYAAGVAAAWMGSADVPARAIDIRTLQRHLVEKGILPEAALTQTDAAPVADDRLEWAVRALPEQWTGLEIVLADTNRALPKLRAAFQSSADAGARLVYAQALGMLGDATGAAELAAAVRAGRFEGGWDFRGMGQFGASLAPIDTLVLALGRSHSPLALEPLLEKARGLDAGVAFSHHRALALALETLGDPRGAPVLAEALRKPGMSGHAVTTIEEARARKFSGGVDTQVRRDALREIALARALYRCGDVDGLGASILRRYADDLHGHYARHARAVLAGRPGVR